jgi:hypothetical protein
MGVSLCKVSALEPIDDAGHCWTRHLLRVSQLGDGPIAAEDKD